MTEGPVAPLMPADAVDLPSPASVGASWVTLVDAPRPATSDAALPSPARTLIHLLAAALAVFALVLVGTSFAASRLAEREAVNDAANTANLLALAVVQPAVTPALLAGDAAAYDAFDAVVRTSVLPNRIVRVKLWRSDGTVVYADERRLVGQRFELGEDQQAALRENQTRAEVSELDRSENTYERYGGKLLEVYRPIWVAGGEELLFEVYGEYAPVQERTNDLWRGLAGLLASALLLLLVLLAPLLWRVIGRLRDAHLTRERMLRSAVEASEAERRRIAASLHDGPVQELVASALAVSGAASRAEAAGQSRLAHEVADAADTVRGGVASLRSLLVDLLPARLSDAGLAAAISDLAGPLTARGMVVRLELDPDAVAALPEPDAQLVYRVTRECLANVVKHAAASGVWVSLTVEPADASGRDTVVLSVLDNGCGFDVAEGLAKPGHVGLSLLVDAVVAAGGVLQVSSAAGAGTAWRLEVAR